MFRPHRALVSLRVLSRFTTTSMSGATTPGRRGRVGGRTTAMGSGGGRGSRPGAAGGRPGGRTARVLAKLQKSVDGGDYYASLQLCQTLANRKRSGGKYAEAQEILQGGIFPLLRAKQPAEAVVLCSDLIAVWGDAKTQVDAHSLGIIGDIARLFPSGDKHVVPFMKEAIDWSKHASPYKHGHPSVYQIAAEQCWRADDFKSAARFFPRGRQPKKHAAMLLDWSKSGYATAEEDLFLARAVLKLLSMKNLCDANILCDEYFKLLRRARRILDTPLVNFLKFLRLTLEREAVPLYKTLITAYKPSLERDPEVLMLAQRIGKVWYGIEAPKTGLAAMMDMMGKMMGGAGGAGAGSRALGSARR